MKRTKSFKFR